MTTHQDYIRQYGENPSEEQVGKFIDSVVTEYKTSDDYRNADTGYRYYRGENDMLKHINMLTTETGALKVDMWSPNHRTTTSCFKQFVDEEVMYLLGNGVNWNDEATNEKLGKRFDDSLLTAAKAAKWGGKSFVYPLGDRPQIMTAREFVPIYNEENGQLECGIYYYQIDDSHPTTYTFFEKEGISKYIRDAGKISVLMSRVPYTYLHQPAVAANPEVITPIPVSRLPIAQFNGNDMKRSEVCAIKSKIDAVDIVRNGFINNLDNADFYWLIENASASSNEDIAKFIDQMKALHAAAVEGETKITPIPVDIPYQARKELIEDLEKALKADYMAVDLDTVIGGGATATQIKAAYKALKTKATDFEACTRTFLYDLLDILGIDDMPTFDPDPVMNTAEEVQTIINAKSAELISQKYATEKILSYLGDKDKIQVVLSEMAQEDMARFTLDETETGNQGEEQNNDDDNDNN